MFVFITDTHSQRAKNILSQHQFSPLKIQTPDGRYLARFSPPAAAGHPMIFGKFVSIFRPNGKTQRFLLT